MCVSCTPLCSGSALMKEHAVSVFVWSTGSEAIQSSPVLKHVWQRAPLTLADMGERNKTTTCIQRTCHTHAARVGEGVPHLHPLKATEQTSIHERVILRREANSSRPLSLFAFSLLHQARVSFACLPACSLSRRSPVKTRTR